MQARYLIPVLALTYLFCVACGGSPTRRPALHPPVTPQQEYRQEAAANNPGSLFAASEADTLFEDSRARRVGDIVVVKLVENTKAQNKAETSSNKKSSNDYQVANMFNRGHAGFLPFTSIGPQPAVGLPILNTGSTSGLTATGKTKRENSQRKGPGNLGVGPLEGSDQGFLEKAPSVDRAKHELQDGTHDGDEPPVWYSGFCCHNHLPPKMLMKHKKRLAVVVQAVVLPPYAVHGLFLTSQRYSLYPSNTDGL